MEFVQNSIWLILNIVSFFTNLPITEIAILSTLGGLRAVWRWKGGWKRAKKAIYSKPDPLLSNANFFSSFADQRQGWVPSYQGCHHEKTSDFGSKNDPTLTRHCATFSPVTAIILFHFWHLYVLENICTKCDKSIWYFYHACATLSSLLLSLKWINSSIRSQLSRFSTAEEMIRNLSSNK